MPREGGYFENLDPKMIEVYKPTFESENIQFTTEREIEYRGQKIKEITNSVIVGAGRAGHTVFTIGHEAAHSMGIDLEPGPVSHPNADKAGYDAYKRFKELYGN